SATSVFFRLAALSSITCACRASMHASDSLFLIEAEPFQFFLQFFPTEGLEAEGRALDFKGRNDAPTAIDLFDETRSGRRFLDVDFVVEDAFIIKILFGLIAIRA